MLKKTGIALVLAFACIGAAYAQVLPPGVEVNVNVETNAFQLEKTDKSDSKLRKEAAADIGQKITLPFGSHDWYNGTGLSFSYNGGFFGGNFSLNVTTSDQQYYDKDRREFFDLYPVHAGAMNAWARLFDGRIKISLGRGIASWYADGQGGEGLRVFNGVEQDSWDKSRNPDDVVQDEGLLLESFLGPVSIGLAGRYYKPELFTESLNPSDPPATQNTRYASMEQRNFSYGARIGSNIGDLGKVNAAYIVEYDNITGKNYKADPDEELVPITGEAEFARHLFGVYASLYPFDKFGVSFSYNGIFTQYPRQIYSQSDRTMVNVTLPTVFQQGINLAFRYDGVDGWVFRTDHNISFWGDKNFKIFRLNALEDAGIAAESALTLGYPTVDHFLVWNGLGVNYRLTNTWRLDMYVRNLYRRDTAEDSEKNIDYRFTRNQTKGEFKVTWQANNYLEMYAGVEIENTVTTLSEDVNRNTATRNSKDSFTVLANAKETRDTTLTFKIPVGITVRVR